MVCLNCKGEGWVCEDHTNMRFEDCPCTEYAGIPCAACNPCDRDNPPFMQPGFEVIRDIDGNHFKPKLVK